MPAQNGTAGTDRPLAVVTGASGGIGFELARQCVENGFDLLIAADRPLENAAATLSDMGATVEAVEADLSTREGVDRLFERIGDRPVEALLANAGVGLGGAFLDQDFERVRHMICTNVVGTIDLIHRVGRTMRSNGSGHILITGSIAGEMPHPFQAVYAATKAFIDSFAASFRGEMADSGVTVTCLLPGATDTDFFARAGLLDTKLNQQGKSDPADVAESGFEAMIENRDRVIPGLKNKFQVMMAHIVPSGLAARGLRDMARPGSG